MTLQKIALLGASVAAIGLPAAVQAATAAHAPAAHAAAGGGDVDGRCMALGLMMTTAQDTRNRGMGAQLLTYYYGRISDRPAKGDLEARLTGHIQSMVNDKQGQGPIIQSCIGQMEASFTALKPVTEHIFKRFSKPAPAGVAAPAAPAPAPAPAPAH
jgi:hypothetical protein